MSTFIMHSPPRCSRRVLSLGTFALYSVLSVSAGCDTRSAGAGDRAVDRNATSTEPRNAEPRADAASAPIGAEAKVAEPAATSSKSAGEWIEVERATLREYSPAIGVLKARQVTKLGSQVSGRVKEVLVDVGDRVKKGDELIRLDPVFFEIEVALRKTDVDSAKVALDDAELNFRRMRNLWEKPEGKEPSVPQKLFDDAKTRREAALVRLRQAEAALRNADERLAEAVIRAPYDGVITDRLVDDGEPVNSAPVTQLVEIQETATLELEFSLPQSYLSRVSPGTPIYFRSEGVADGSEEAASIATVFPSVDEATRSFRCRAYVPNEDAHSRPGILVAVRVLVREVKDVLTIPRKCLARSTRGWKVSTLASGHASERDVEIGMEEADRVEVREGLDASSKVWQPREVES